jgi:hypothetical protein
MNIYASRRGKFISDIWRHQFPSIFTVLILIPGFIFLSETSWADIRNAASCSAADVQAVINSASAGDTVRVPSGNCSWSSGVSLNKSITLTGGYGGTTTITGGVLNFSANDARVCYFTFTAGDIRVSGCTRGLIDHIRLNSSSSSIEFIHVYGPNDAWSTNSTLGTAENIFIEDCNFNAGGGSAQCVQGNFNARVVFRHNTIYGMKFDAHGIWSNGSQANYCNWTKYTDAGYLSDAHSCRTYEVYENTWTWEGNGAQGAIELRGGTGVVYNNKLAVDALGITLRDYCGSNTNGNCCPNGTILCPSQYPWRDQIGRGRNQELEPLYLWNNTANGNPVVGYNHNATNWPATILFASILAASHESYCGTQTGWQYGGTTTCDMSALIQENRDYYVGQKPGYTAYTYPHPLQEGVSVPSPPKNLRITQ